MSSEESPSKVADFLYKWLLFIVIPFIVVLLYWAFVLFSEDEKKITVIQDEKEFIVNNAPDEVKVINKMLKNYTPDTPVQNREVAENMSLATQDAADLLDDLEASNEDGAEEESQVDKK